jgi:cation diffusion facilitator CzcD-associated flavoprotein CzcO
MGKDAIIGGGISGIMLSYRLKQKGLGSGFFEKFRGVEWQYFTNNKPETISLLHELESNRITWDLNSIFTIDSVLGSSEGTYD